MIVAIFVRVNLFAVPIAADVAFEIVFFFLDVDILNKLIKIGSD